MGGKGSGGRRPGAGRKSTAPEGHRVGLMVQVRPATYERIRAQAEAERRSMSEVAAEVLDGAAPTPPSSPSTGELG
jgi:hypothetical protein